MKQEKSQLSEIIKLKRKELGLTQEEFSARVGVGLRFLRELEQGKETIRLDKLNVVLNYLGLEVGAVSRRDNDE
jgi:y4mF family transcriptional regulator